MRYKAPEHTSGVYAPSRHYAADEAGVIEVPEDTPEADHVALRSVGCVMLPEQEAAKPPVSKPPAGSADESAAAEEALGDDLARGKPKA